MEKNSNINSNISTNASKNPSKYKVNEAGTLNVINNIVIKKENQKGIKIDNNHIEEILQKFKAIKDSEIISFGRVLGEGAYGIVVEVFLNYSQKKFAAKLVSKTVDKTIISIKKINFQL